MPPSWSVGFVVDLRVRQGGLPRGQRDDRAARHDVVAALVAAVDGGLDVTEPGPADPFAGHLAADPDGVAEEVHPPVLDVDLGHPAVVAAPVGDQVGGPTPAL